MAFFEDRFPDSIAQGGRGGPRFKTSRAMTTSGNRQANKEWSSPLHAYNVAQAIKSQADFDTVLSFFMVVYGAFDGFRFKDYADYKVAATRGVCTLITGSTYQLGKSYAFGARSWVRTIKKPVASTVVVYRTRSAATNVITPTLDGTTGQLIVSGHLLGDTYSWSGEFDVPCAFSEDMLEAEQIGADGGLFMSWQSIPIEEIRL